MADNQNGGLLGNLTGTLDTTLTGGEQQDNKGGLLGTAGGLLGGVTDTAGKTVGGVTDTAGKTVGGVTDTAGNTLGGLSGQQQQKK